VPSFFDQDSAASTAQMIRIESDDPVLDVHLVPR
jgi:hypothetical protein